MPVQWGGRTAGRRFPAEIELATCPATVFRCPGTDRAGLPMPCETEVAPTHEQRGQAGPRACPATSRRPRRGPQDRDVQVRRPPGADGPVPGHARRIRRGSEHGHDRAARRARGRALLAPCPEVLERGGGWARSRTEYGQASGGDHHAHLPIPTALRPGSHRRAVPGARRGATGVREAREGRGVEAGRDAASEAPATARRGTGAVPLSHRLGRRGEARRAQRCRALRQPDPPAARRRRVARGARWASAAHHRATLGGHGGTVERGPGRGRAAGGVPVRHRPVVARTREEAAAGAAGAPVLLLHGAGRTGGAGGPLHRVVTASDQRARQPRRRARRVQPVEERSSGRRASPGEVVEAPEGQEGGAGAHCDGARVGGTVGADAGDRAGGSTSSCRRRRSCGSREGCSRAGVGRGYGGRWRWGRGLHRDHWLSAGSDAGIMSRR